MRSGKGRFIHAQEVSIAILERPGESRDFRKEFRCLRAERRGPEVSPGMNGSCIEFQKAGLIRMKLEAQFLAAVGCSRFAAVWRSEEKQPILRLRYAGGRHRG